MTEPTIGSLCSGYGGLDLGLTAAVGGNVVWHAETDPAAARVLAERWPGIPNLGDITTVDWTTVPDVDWLTAGYPCQPYSEAGQRKGTDDERHLWPAVARAIRHLRPRYVLLENVKAHLRRGFPSVLNVRLRGILRTCTSIRCRRLPQEGAALRGRCRRRAPPTRARLADAPGKVSGQLCRRSCWTSREGRCRSRPCSNPAADAALRRRDRAERARRRRARSSHRRAAATYATGD